MKPTKLITDLLEQHFTPDNPLRQIALVACGGSLVDMYPAHYFLGRESVSLRSTMMTANEFVYAPPKTLGSQTLTIVCSHGGNTPESVAAARLAQSRGSATIALTHNSDAELLNHATAHICYEWGDNSQVVNNPMAQILCLCMEAVAKTEGYAARDAFLHSLDRIDEIIARARRQVAPNCQAFAERFQLTAAQGRVLELVAQGKSNRDIAEFLGLSEGTVKVHVSAILRALGVTSRAQALLMMTRAGLRV